MGIFMFSILFFGSTLIVVDGGAERSPELELRLLNAIHNEHCPASQHCSPPSNLKGPSMANANASKHEIDGSCCKQCSCDLQSCALNLTCCPDTLDHLPTVEESRAKEKITCEYAQLRRAESRVTSGISYWMLRKCADDFTDSEVSLKCESNTIIRPLDMELLLPVTDLSTGTTYQNRHCALCNHIDDSALQTWNAKLECRQGTFIPSNIDTVIEDILQAEFCDILYEPTDAINAGLDPSTSRCENVISECNVTGLWASFDPFFENACHAYLAVYGGKSVFSADGSSSEKYRNIFCYMCNEIVEPLIRCERPGSGHVFVSFSAILQLKSETSVPDTVPGSDSCSASQIMDPLKNQCKEVTCLPPKIFLYGNCTDTVSTMSGVYYEAYIKVVPYKPLDVAALPDFAKQLTIKLESMVILDKGFLRYISLYDMFYKHALQYSSPGQVAGTVVVEYVVFHIKMYRRYNALPFLNNVLAIDGKDDFIFVEYTSSDGQLTTVMIKVQFELDVYWNVGQSDGETKYLGVRDGSILTYFGQMYPFLPSRFSVPFGLQVITKTTGCPLVNISDYTSVSLPNNDLFVREIGFNFTANAYIKTGNNINSILVCRDDFIPLAEKQLKQEPMISNTPTTDNSKPLGILSFVCVVFSLVCLVLTLVTYLAFKDLRTQPGINNMCLVLSLIIAQSLYQFGVGQADQVPAWGCQTLGVLIHFFWLMSVFWMNVCSYHMFRVFSSLTKISRGGNVVKRTILYSLYCFTASAVFVAINLVVSSVKSSSTEMGYGGTLCYVSDYFMNLYTFAIPVGVVVLINISLFICVVVKVTRMPTVDKTTRTNRNYVKIYAKLSCLTGVSWVFGFLTYTEIAAFEYLFIIFSAGQGVFIFLSFVCNARVLKHLLHCVKEDTPTSGSIKANYSNDTVPSHIGPLDTSNNDNDVCNAEPRNSTCSTNL